MSYPATPVFWVEPSGRTARGVRTYVGVSPNEPKCSDGHAWHDATVWIDVVDTVIKSDLDGTRLRREVDNFDPVECASLWPKRCDSCDYEFGPDANKQTNSQEIYRRYDGCYYVLPFYRGKTPPGVLKMPPGAMYDAYWYPDRWQGEDGIALCVILPNGKDWCVDSPASNCTRPKEIHKCWVRHGDPRLGDITVDKNGDTCAAGAGSIAAGDYHGFLQNGTWTAG